MATATVPKNPIADWEKVRDDWLQQLNALMAEAKSWGEELGWATRLIQKKMDDSQIGCYLAPALHLQDGTTRVLLEPIARFAPGLDGVVDLYRMPAYDDIATVSLRDGKWRVHYWLSSGEANGDVLDTAPPIEWSKENLEKVLNEMRTDVT